MRIFWFFKKKKTPRRKKVHRRLRASVWRYVSADYQLHKNEAERISREKVEYFTQLIGTRYNRLSIRNQRTRWGSCSLKKNLSINYRIVHLPENLRNYVIAHEVCHLKEFNHSKNFWTLVEVCVPDHKEVRKELRAFERKFRKVTVLRLHNNSLTTQK